MRRWLIFAIILVLAACAGCSPSPHSSGNPSGGSASSTSSSGDDGTGGGPSCTGDVSDACGVFVSAAAAPGGNGKMATPFQTFAEAAAAKPARVFACAGTYTETKQARFSGGVAIYGGFTGCSPTL